jgi:hypothetical protein
MATTRTQKIVNLVATLTVSPTPSTLQQSGAMVSVGGTSLATGAYQFVGSLTQALTVIGTGGNSTELTAMVTTHFAQGNAVGVYILELGSSITTPDDGIAALDTWVNKNPGIFYGYLTPADWDTTPAPAAPKLSSISGGTLDATTYYVKIAYVSATGATGETSVEESLAVIADDLLEVASPPSLLGATGYNVYVSDAAGAETLQNTTPVSIGTNWTEPTTGLVSGTVPPLTMAQVCSDFSSPTSKVYFCQTTTPVNSAAYGTFDSTGAFLGYKAAITFGPSPSASSSEFGAAVMLYNLIVNNPGASNKLAPVQLRFVYGVTPWPDTGETTSIDTLLTNNANMVGTGAEGGISNSCIFGGTVASGIQISWWYGIDWEQITLSRGTAADVINGSNSNPPLLYDQAGINLLDANAQQRADNGVTFGCALSAVVTATPFYTYAQQNPNHYSAGTYNGLLATIVGQTGFMTLTFYLDAVEFVAAA